MRSAILFLAACLTAVPAGGAFADSPTAPEATAVPEVDLLSTPAATMSQDQLEAFFTHQKKGMPVQLTLEKGKAVRGLFSSYDDYYETIWIVPRDGEKGMFNQKGYKLSGVRNAAFWDVKASSPAGFSALASSSSTEGTFRGADYYLLKQDGE